MRGEGLGAKAPLGYEREHLGHQCAHVRSPDVQGGVAPVHQQKGNARTAVQAPRARADAVRGGAGQRQSQIAGADVDDQRGGRAAAQLAGVQGLEAQTIGEVADGCAAVGEPDVARAEGVGDQTRVERDAGSEQRAGTRGREDQDLGLGVSAQQGGQMGGEVAVGVVQMLSATPAAAAGSTPSGSGTSIASA